MCVVLLHRDALTDCVAATVVPLLISDGLSIDFLSLVMLVRDSHLGKSSGVPQIQAFKIKAHTCRPRLTAEMIVKQSNLIIVNGDSSLMST